MRGVTMKEKLKKFTKKYFRIRLCLLIAVFVSLFHVYLKSPYFLVVVLGNSMQPTYHTYQSLYFTKKIDELNKGDVIVFHLNNETYIKRITGVSNDYYLKEFIEPVMYSMPSDLQIQKFRQYPSLKRTIKCPQIPKNKFFVEGDNSPDSLDSRNYGLIDRSNIFGKLYKIN